MPTRKVVEIDPDKCDGCELCVSACHEGAIALVDGKAKLVSESYCDGLGACLPECPRGAITIVEREAEAFDALAVAAAHKSCRPSALANWPIQLHLAPIQARAFQGATLLVAADCVPFAYADFHSRLLGGRTLLIGCPKLDDTSAYLEKLTAILRFNDVRAVEVAFMEVPCCHGLARLVGQAIAASGKPIPLGLIEVSIQGEIIRPAARASA